MFESSIALNLFARYRNHTLERVSKHLCLTVLLETLIREMFELHDNLIDDQENVPCDPI